MRINYNEINDIKHKCIYWTVENLICASLKGHPVNRASQVHTGHCFVAALKSDSYMDVIHQPVKVTLCCSTFTWNLEKTSTFFFLNLEF